jgi:hypothetical protein
MSGGEWWLYPIRYSFRTRLVFVFVFITADELRFWEELLRQYLAPEVSHAINQVDKEKYARRLPTTRGTQLLRIV